MKRFVSILLTIFVTTSLFSQVPDHIKRRYTNSTDVFTVIPINKPDNFNNKAINPGVSINASYVVPFGKSNFAFSIGGGFTFYNYYLKSLPKDMVPTALHNENWGEDFYFIPTDSLQNSLSVSKNKMSLNYIDIPLEFRYRANNGLKFTAGVKIGFLINSHHKYKGTDFIFGTTDAIKIKKYKLNNLSNFQIGPIVRFGWKWFNLYASYSLVSVYDPSGGSKLNPLSIGISFTPDGW
ncbi:MAG: outer membrane beta-barrel protein [Bacteroidales bacterium]|jgi:hypothetical protein